MKVEGRHFGFKRSLKVEVKLGLVLVWAWQWWCVLSELLGLCFLICHIDILEMLVYTVNYSSGHME